MSLWNESMDWVYGLNLWIESMDEVYGLSLWIWIYGVSVWSESMDWIYRLSLWIESMDWINGLMGEGEMGEGGGSEDKRKINLRELWWLKW